MKILFCQLRSYGDIIRTFPTIKAVRTMYPNAFLGFTCVEEMLPAARLCEELDAIYTQPRLKAYENHVGHTRIVDVAILAPSLEAVKAVGFDYYFDFQGTFQSALFGLAANIPKRIGSARAKDGASLFYSHLYEGQWREMNRMQRHVNLVKTVFPSLSVESHVNKPLCEAKDGDIIIAPGTSQIGVYKRWPVENFVALVNFLYVSYKVVVQILCSEGEQEIGQQIFEQAVKGSCYVTVCSDFKEAQQVIRLSKAFIGGDSAYTHIATVNGIPSFMLIGPTSINENRPWPNVINGFASLKLSCSPCDLWSQKCANGIACMTMLKPDLVQQEISQFLHNIFK